MDRSHEAAWAAGIVDGEGSVTMLRARPGVNRRKTLAFQVRVSVRMTHEDTVRRLHSAFGGVFKVGPKPRRAVHKQTFEWYVGDRAAERVLAELIPYMTTKQAQAALVIEFRRTCCVLRPGGRRETPPELVERRSRYFDTLAGLNRKGVAV